MHLSRQMRFVGLTHAYTYMATLPILYREYAAFLLKLDRLVIVEQKLKKRLKVNDFSNKFSLQ